MKKRLLIDINSAISVYATGKVSGIGRTALELLQAMAKVQDLPFEVMLYSQNMRGISGKVLALPFKSRHVYLRHTSFWNEMVSRCGIREAVTGYDLMHIPHNYEHVRYPSKCIVTLHDALFMKAPAPTNEQTHMQRIVPSFVQQCKHIITCSESSKNDILETMSVPGEKISVIYWGVQHDLFKPPTNKMEAQQLVAQKYGIVNPYFFTLSCNAKRKRADVLLHSFLDYCKHEPCPHDLVLIWSNPPESIVHEVSVSNARDKIHFINSVTNEELALLYHGAKALFFPSSYEGFGLPVVEAMACGTPVVTCRNSSLKEIAGDAAIYLDEPVEESIPRVIDGFVKGVWPLNEFIAKGLQRASEFTWEKCAEQTVEVYKRCLGI